MLRSITHTMRYTVCLCIRCALEMSVVETNPLRDPWLVAVWPGMGNVAIGAGAYLIAKLNAHLVAEMPNEGVFDLTSIDVKAGLAKPSRLPRGMFFEWRNPAPGGQGRDLMIFVGEAQPPAHGFAYCQRLLVYAEQRGVKRLYTFAAMATQLHPSNHPRVFGAATDEASLSDLRKTEVILLKEGQISGLNGVLLAAGSERGIAGTCLLGELPFFAAGVPNPKASQAVLEVFASMSGIEIDFADLKPQVVAVEQALLQMLEKMQEAAREQGEELEVEEADETATEPEDGASDGSTGPPKIDDATSRKIEQLFAAAEKDRGNAMRLKQELDKHNVFKQYEDRFLDLFRKAD